MDKTGNPWHLVAMVLASMAPKEIPSEIIHFNGNGQEWVAVITLTKNWSYFRLTRLFFLFFLNPWVNYNS